MTHSYVSLCPVLLQTSGQQNARYGATEYITQYLIVTGIPLSCGAVEAFIQRH